jgi:hypothetical protein
VRFCRAVNWNKILLRRLGDMLLHSTGMEKAVVDAGSVLKLSMVK